MMLTNKLEKTWEAATHDQRVAAIIRAKDILANMVHYQGGHRYYTDDVERLAAELLPEPIEVVGNERQAENPHVNNHHLFEVLYEFTASPAEGQKLREWVDGMKAGHMDDDAITKKMVFALYDGLFGRMDWPWTEVR